MATLSGALLHLPPNNTTGGEVTVTPGSGPSFHISALSLPLYYLDHDTVIGAANDLITGGTHDRIVGGAHDTIIGGSYDTIIGGTRDSITGGGHDRISMGSHDTIVAAAGDSIIGGKHPGFDTITANGGHETVVGTAAHETVSGFDTVTGPGHDTITFAGENQASIQKVVATQEVKAGNTTLHLPDGSSITLVGISHVDPTFFH